MSVRAFAYGGFRFVERLRIGRFPELPISVFEDYYNIPVADAPPWIGFCILSDQPFLLWKELLNPESRGGYPFTVLLDPGEEELDRLKWNTGWLLAHLFDRGRGVARKLMTSAEDVSASELTDWIRSTPEPPAGHSAHSQARALWAAGALDDRVLALPPSVIGSEYRPTAQDISGLQSTLPVGLRNSGGWLVGGGTRHAKAVGVRLVIDERTAEPPPDLDDRVREGTKVLEALRVDSIPARARALLEDDFKRQAWRSGSELKLAIEAIDIFKRLDGNLPDLIAYIKRLPPGTKRNAWAQWACEMAAGDTAGTPSAAATELMAGEALAGRFTLTASQPLHRPTLERMLDAAEIPPNAVPPTLELPEDILVSRWIDRLASSAENAPPLLAVAVEQVPDAYHEKLVAAAWRAAGANANLNAWDGLLQVGSVRDKVRKEGRSRFRSGAIGLDDYERYAGSDDWEWLRQNVDSGKAFERFVHQLVKHKRNDALDRVMLWPQRREMSLAERQRIGRELQSAWTHLISLHRLFHGESIEPASLHPEVQKVLRADFEDYIRQALRPRSAPNLAGILELVGELGTNAARILQSLDVTEHICSAADGWLRGWKQLDPNTHDRELSRAMLSWLFGDQDLGSPEDFATEEGLVQFVREVAFGSRTYTDAEYVRMLERLLEEWSASSKFRSAFKAAFENSKGVQRARLNSRLRQSAHALELVQQVLSESDRDSLRADELGSALDGPEDLPPLDDFETLLDHAGPEKLQEAVARRFANNATPECRTSARRLAESLPHLTKMLERLDDARQRMVVEAIFEVEAPLDESFPRDKLHKAIREVLELGPYGRMAALHILSSRELSQWIANEGRQKSFLDWVRGR
jgi:hypothetical protein